MILAAVGSVFSYFVNLKRCVWEHKEETNAKIKIIDDRSLWLSTTFLHFVRGNDELHRGSGTTTISLVGGIENLLKDPKTGKL